MMRTIEALARSLLSGDRQNVIEMGSLNLPSGKVVLCDPLELPSDECEHITARPGKYPVRLTCTHNKDWGTRVSGAGLVLSNSKVVQWEEAYASPVLIEHGLCSLMDLETASLFKARLQEFLCRNPAGNYYMDILDTEFRANADPDDDYDRGNYNMHYPVTDGVHGVAMFSSGLGDGLYESHWGLDKERQPVILVVDFGLINGYV